MRGPGGGYRLAVDTNDINIADIVDAVDESIDATNCNGRGNCHDGTMCLTHHLWMDLSVQIRDFLKSISLAALIEREEIRRVALQQRKRQASAKIPLTAI